MRGLGRERGWRIRMRILGAFSLGERGALVVRSTRSWQWVETGKSWQWVKAGCHTGVAELLWTKMSHLVQNEEFGFLRPWTVPFTSYVAWSKLFIFPEFHFLMWKMGGITDTSQDCGDEETMYVYKVMSIVLGAQ